jgi:pSer/pThr/pTyr-binding forkhead associated (FHA) protein
MILPLQARVVIGRSPRADFIVADQSVSSTHALLTYDGAAWTLEDAGSTNGTFLNGWRVADSILVGPGDELTIGETTFMLAHPSA